VIQSIKFDICLIFFGLSYIAAGQNSIDPSAFSKNLPQ
jgi:hypothetical protein